MELGDILVGLGLGAVIFVLILLLLAPIIISFVLGVAIANFFGVTGLLWWCAVIFIALVLYGILYVLYKN